MTSSFTGTTCEQAVKSCNSAIAILQGAFKERQPFPSPDSVQGGVVALCASCRKNGGDRKCTGWVLNLRQGRELRFEATVGGRLVHVLVEGRQEWKYGPKRDLGPGLPDSGSFAVTILDENYNVITRQHSDVANVGQPGSIGHLQVGGLPSTGPRPGHEWLDVPRWPMMPMDFILVIELLLYSFFPGYWLEKSEYGPWQRAVKLSENQMYAPWRARMETYWNSRVSRDSWLKEQCNISSSWR